ncbi:hypothetical protein L1D14_20565 [Vibrio tubiashii]|uniref:hypothetical protein n=1 Tax=Vibrio tubiashii TaxID=29498 RepID=UPI001EFD08B3|nr:hypothetical protein [Vibrio tubiashii]MCG9578615.1 hypothetical protein [Vibrio tubiashii]
MTLKSKFVVAMFLIASSLNALASEMFMSIQEVEQRQLEIINSDRSTEEKIKALDGLKKLLASQNSLLEEMKRTKALNAPPSNTKQESSQSTSQSTIPVKFEAPTGWDLDTIFVAEIYGVGEDLDAELYVNGENVPVNLQRVKLEKTKLGNFTVVDYDPFSVTFHNSNTNETLVRITTSADLIASKINHNNKIREKYNEAFAMGTLEAQLQTFKDNTRAPIPVSYQTQQTPAVFDSGE